MPSTSSLRLLVPSSTRAANSTGSAEPSGNSEIENAFAINSRDFNLKYFAIAVYSLSSFGSYRTSSFVCDAV